MLDYWSRDMLHFDLLEKGLRVTPPYYMIDFLWKMFLMLYSLNKFKCLIAFTSLNIGQYVYLDCSFVNQVVILSSILKLTKE